MRRFKRITAVSAL